MKKLLIFLLIPFLNIKVIAQCNENQFEILCSTFSGEWAEEISWSIINNVGNTIFSFSGFETENNTEYNDVVCLEIGCYVFEANDSYGDGWNEAYVDISSEDNSINFNQNNSTIELESGSISYTLFNINDSNCVFYGLGCTDENANNYNSGAFIDNDSCVYDDCGENMYQLEIDTYTGNWGEEMSWVIHDTNSWETQAPPLTSFTGTISQQTITTQICIENGCYLIEGFDSYGDGWNQGSVTVSFNKNGNTVEETFSFEEGYYGYFDFEVAQKSCEWEIPGCTNQEAYNYNEFATIDNGSCILAEFFEFDKIEREFILYIPENLEDNASLVFVLHGYTGSAIDIMNYSGMNTVADENGFAVCYPQGVEDNFGNTFFNVGYAFQENETVNDVGFIVSLAEYLQSTYSLSTTNTFATGMSNGGDMSYMLACQASNTFRAIAPVAGAIFEDIYNSCNPVNPIPVFETHGTNDDVTLFEGDPYNNDGWGVYLDIPSTIDYFVNQNNLTTMNVENLPDINENDGSTIESYIYSSTETTNEVWLYKVINGGHDWPGAYGNMDVNISEEIWDFFSLMSLSNTISTNEDVQNSPKLIKTIDLLGRQNTKNRIQLKIYDDGSVSKKISSILIK